jgi:aminopeptidase C
LKTAGVVAATAGREAIQELLVDVARRPQQAKNVMAQVWETMPTIMHRPPQNSGYRGEDGQRRYHQEQQEAFQTSFSKSFVSLGVAVPKVVAPLLEDPLASARLCEIIVDVLEEAEPQEERGCSALIQHFLQELDG